MARPVFFQILVLADGPKTPAENRPHMFCFLTPTSYQHNHGNLLRAPPILPTPRKTANIAASMSGAPEKRAGGFVLCFCILDERGFGMWWLGPGRAMAQRCVTGRRCMCVPPFPGATKKMGGGVTASALALGMRSSPGVNPVITSEPPPTPL